MKFWERGLWIMTRVCSVLILCVLLSGCASLWEREIYETLPHIAQEDTVIPAAALTVNSSDALKNAIIGIIRSGKSEEDIRVTDFPGELTRLYVSGLLSEIQKQEPIGAYTVDYMSFDLNQILSQYIINLNIEYRHDTRPRILPVSGRRELEEAVHSALDGYSPLLTVEMRYFYARDHDVEGMVRAYYYNNPLWAMEYPEISVGLYPPAGDMWRRIVELSLNWESAPWELRRMARNTESAAVSLLSEMPEFSGNEEEVAAHTVLWIYELLCGHIQYDAETSEAAIEGGERRGGEPYTAFGALVNGLAVSEGYAMAFKLLCDISGIDSQVVTGQYAANRHFWNLVQIGGYWYHISAALEIFLLSDDDEAMEQFTWDKSAYPAAAQGEWTLAGIRGPADPEDE
jgi:hypothetical protein